MFGTQERVFNIVPRKGVDRKVDKLVCVLNGLDYLFVCFNVAVVIHGHFPLLGWDVFVGVHKLPDRCEEQSDNDYVNNVTF